MNILTEQLDTEQRLVHWETIIETNNWNYKQDIDKIRDAYYEAFEGSILIENGKQPIQKMSQVRTRRLMEDIRRIKAEAQSHRNS